MNRRIFLAALLAAFAGGAWAGETVLDEKSSRELESGTYVVTNSVKFEGTDGTGESGLSVKDGAHVKIRIEKEATLTCIGGSGTNAVAGGDGQMPRFGGQTSRENGYGISYGVMTFNAALAGTGANRSGGGGGAGILVPTNSSLTVFGEGALVATGGNGGNGGKGGASASGAFHVISWYGLAGSWIDTNWNYLVWLNRFHSTNSLENVISGKATSNHYNWWYNAQPASGGGGGGGAGGGGAGIGLPGLDGGVGGAGGAVQSVWGLKTESDLSPTNGVTGSAATAHQATKCGTIRIALSSDSVTVTGGKGGGQGVSATDGGAEDDQLVWCYDGAGQRSTKVDLYMYNGRGGGGGGKGGTGAPYGTGGGGGVGGSGGYSGGIAFNPTNLPNWASNIGTNGLAGAKGHEIQPFVPIGFFVNGTDVGDLSGTGWKYDRNQKILTLGSAMPYVLSGTATNDEVQVNVTDSGATVVLSNVTVFASERSAVVLKPGATLKVAANQVLMAGKKNPEDLRYATDCGSSWCVLAATGVTVTVTVEGIPHVTGFTVSNAVQVITNGTVAASCRVLAGDSIFVGYTVKGGYFTHAPNPLVYRSVDKDIVVDARTLGILPYISYRTWEGGGWRTARARTTPLSRMLRRSSRTASGTPSRARSRASQSRSADRRISSCATVRSCPSRAGRRASRWRQGPRSQSTGRRTARANWWRRAAGTASASEPIPTGRAAPSRSTAAG